MNYRCDVEAYEGLLLHILSMGMHVQCMSEGRSIFPPGTVCILNRVAALKKIKYCRVAGIS